MDKILKFLFSFSGTVGIIIFLIVLYYIIKRVLDRQVASKPDISMMRSIILFSIFLIGFIAIILSLPMADSTRSNITSLIGIVISAVLALSSATFIGNGLAGIMMRSINNYKPGDFISVESYFGRITERGLFHTEIQTEDRDLTTIPNLFLATNPVKVMRSTGTFISGIVSLGYEVHRTKIEKTLIAAAKEAGLKDPFVRITELGDFSVVYKVFGLVADIKTVLSAKSRLNSAMLDALHDAGIEIVSPNFVNQNQLAGTGAVFIPKKPRKVEDVKQSDLPEAKIFDKAEEAETIEKKKDKITEIDKKLVELEAKAKTDVSAEEKEKLKAEVEKWTNIKTKMAESVVTKTEEIDKVQ